MIEIGVLLMAFALVAVVVRLAWPQAPRWLDWVPFGLFAAAVLRLLIAFLTGDVSMEYVHLYTKKGIELPWRIAGVWTGREGSLLLWVTLLALVQAIAVKRVPKVAATLLRVQLLGLGLVYALHDPWRATPDFLLQGRPDGNGFNPTLENWFILIHPPLMFLAYALTSVPLAAGLAHMLRREGWSKWSLDYTRYAWILYTVAMALGGAWAYETLGFGGFWAWDPVEVANLLPWLALTALLHIQTRHARSEPAVDSAAILATLPFIMTMMSTLSTRSGLWVSVHAFTDPTNTFEPDPLLRMSRILEADPTVGTYLALMVGTLLLSLAAWHKLQVGKWRPTGIVLFFASVVWFVAPATAYALTFAYTTPLGTTAQAILAVVLPILLAALPTLRSNQGTSVRALPLSTVASLLLLLSLQIALTIHFASANGWSEAFWTTRLPFYAAPLVLGLAYYLTKPFAKRRFWMAGFLVPAVLVPFDHGIASIVGTVYLFSLALLRAHHTLPREFFGRLLALIGLSAILLNFPGPIAPVALRGVGAVAVLAGLAVAGFWNRPRAQHLVLIHLSISLLFVGYSLPTYLEHEEIRVAQGEGAFQYQFIPFEERPSVVEEIIVRDPGSGAVARLIYEPDLGIYRSLPGIVHGWTGDTYLRIESLCVRPDCTGNRGLLEPFQPRPPLGVLERVTAVEWNDASYPGIALLWVGATFMAFFVAALTRADPKKRDPQQATPTEAVQDAPATPHLGSGPAPQSLKSVQEDSEP